MCLGGCVGVESVQVKEQSAFNARVTGVRYERERKLHVHVHKTAWIMCTSCARKQIGERESLSIKLDIF